MDDLDLGPELGADPQAVPILVGLGVDELSLNPAGIPAVKAAISTRPAGGMSG